MTWYGCHSLRCAVVAIAISGLVGWQARGQEAEIPPETAAAAEAAVEAELHAEYDEDLLVPLAAWGWAASCCCEDDCCPDAEFPMLGTRMLHFAPFEVDFAKPGKYMRVRLDSAYEFTVPDRAEYFWSAIGAGGPPAAERSVDYIDFRVQLENGAGPISFLTELPLRSVNPEVNPNTTGFADMNFAVKSAIIEKQRFVLSSIFRTYLLTGDDDRGLGVGHVSLEPGILGTFALNTLTYLHGELKLWIPVGADADFKGEILRYGGGASHVVYQDPCEKFAAIATCELVCWSVLDGQGTQPDGTILLLDGDTTVNIYPGIRFEYNEKWDLGISGGWALTNQRWYDGLLRADFRILF